MVTRRLLAAGAVALPLLLLAPSSAHAAPSISRTTVMERARTIWPLDAGTVPYSMGNCYDLRGRYVGPTPCDHGSYRSDCSGYVSMAWRTHNWLTVGDRPLALTGVAGARSLSSPIAYRSLRAGDALAYQRSSGAGAHIVLFSRWADAAKSRPVIWELAGGTMGPRERTWSPTYRNTYTAWRYDGIS